MSKLSPPVIYYHSVAPAPFDHWVQRFLTQSLDSFEDQMAYLRAKGFHSVFLSEWMAFRRGEKAVSGREILLSFDDGLLDNWVYAYPVAKKYGMRLTLFVCPELVDPRDIVRPNLDDLWAGRCRKSDLDGCGNLSWNELKIMQESGYVDVQSHTMTHAKYVVSTHLETFYYGGFRGMHTILNTFPEIKPDYMNDRGFERRLPLGTPLFEEHSAVVARKLSINPGFIAEINTLAERFDLAIPEHRPVFEAAARQIHQHYLRNDELVESIESDIEYRSRLEYEIVESRRIIESRLGKPVQFLCWPHGDNTHEAHAMARNAGYLATTAGKLVQEGDKTDRIPRLGAAWTLGKWLNHQKFHYKISSHYRKQPYYTFWLANAYKNKILQRS